MKHYQRWYRNGDPNTTLLEYDQNLPSVCSIEDCDNTHHAKGLCSVHYSRLWRLTAARPRCELEGCDKPNHARGRCRSHYGKLVNS